MEDSPACSTNPHYTSLGFMFYMQGFQTVGRDLAQDYKMGVGEGTGKHFVKIIKINN
jgi:hypothetical protein